MRFQALACDYDGTIATDGRVDDATVDALDRLARSGRRLILVTGRELDDLIDLFPRLDLFDRVVAENGALLYRPGEQERVPLAEPPKAEFVDMLRERGVEPLSVGAGMVATWQPHEGTVLDVIRELGLELQVVFNKGAVMVLPAGVNKATGLDVALAELGLSAHSVVGVGDAENDHAFLAACECAVAVAGAVPSLRESCDLVTEDVVELARLIVDDDLADVALDRHDILLGDEVKIRAYGERILIAGPSHSGKSTVAAALVERIQEAGYQIILIDPEGDYAEGLGDAVVLGDPERAPTHAEVLRVVDDSSRSVVVNLLGVPIDDRPGYFEQLLMRIAAVWGRVGRPHWLVVDEAHHMVPEGFHLQSSATLDDAGAVLAITVHPGSVSAPVLSEFTAVIAVGDEPAGVLDAFNQAERPEVPDELETGELVLWRPGDDPVQVTLTPSTGERRRHIRKYAAGTLGDDSSFYFRGPDDRLNLKADNLNLFLRLGEGVDEDTWEFHRGNGDYSRWMAGCVKDEELAAAVAEVEQSGGGVDEGRARIRELVEERYTAPE
ncbi:HAD-IIB family hydrolase [Herbidospora galbida]|uniref:HAD-IIB family hydrolase n=1 Tax=Herbidospora galbida TaxID=2575442 RepID=A0A4U3MMX8_9ACTN|nr:HAD-IIB family hydrolase [Herbidospora galbida]TKK90199.1 HAD-IIB family hydrolase [Herbidospora galbida]